MQWLIDLIIERIGIPPVYINRGDPVGYDWTKATLIQDFIWRDLDCSSIVPAGASAIHFFSYCRHFNTNKTLELRTKGHVNDANRNEVRTQVANIALTADLVCGCESDRILQYRASAPAWIAIRLIIKGWWL